MGIMAKQTCLGCGRIGHGGTMKRSCPFCNAPTVPACGWADCKQPLSDAHKLVVGGWPVCDEHYPQALAESLLNPPTVRSFIVDPALVDIDDVINAGPGKLVRVKQPMWGMKVTNL